jgi:hypothetical protein
VEFNLPVLANMKNDIQVITKDPLCKPVDTIRYSYYAKGRTTEKLRFNSLQKQQIFSSPRSWPTQPSVYWVTVLFP